MVQDDKANPVVPVASSPDYFHQYLHRTILLLGQDAVETLRTKTVAIAGCGGHGGAAAITLARMGVQGFILADPNPFDEPDINRQWGANRATLGRNKARVYDEILRSINPDVRVKVFDDGVTPTNVASFVYGADFLVDCLDVAVPAALRAQLFREARARGIHAATGANLGFGGMVATASPDGMPLEFLGGIEDDAIQGSKLPPVLNEVFVPEFLQQIEESLHLHRVPSVAVAPALLGALLSVEAVAAMLGGVIPGWRPPICLPQVLLVDLLRMNYRVMHLDELGAKRPDVVQAEPAASTASVEPAGRRNRAALLAQVGYNTNLLADDGIDVDLMTDSWSEIPFSPSPQTAADRSIAPPEEVLRGLYGYTHILPVFRGRFAEALLARSLKHGDGIIITNGLFPTTQFHLESTGMEVREMPCRESHDAASSFGFKGNLDLEALDGLLASPQGRRVNAICLELCANASGGHPVSLAHMGSVRQRLAGRDVRLILDVTRAFENAELLRQREEGLLGKPLAAIVRALCSYSDIGAASCTKDFKTPIGGFVATRDSAHATVLRDLTLACGDGLSSDTRRALGRSLADFALWNRQSSVRVTQSQRLWDELRKMGVPVVTPAGGHGVFIDARSLLPHIGPEQYVGQALANELFMRSGVRGSVNFTTPTQARSGVQLLRLAIPIARYGDRQLAAVLGGFKSVLSDRSSIRGLKQTYSPPGAIGAFAATYQVASAG